jgi:tryptophan-rich hypothetical protein
MKRTALSPRKLLRTKWTAVVPRNKDKHFMVTRVLEPATVIAGATPAIEYVELEAVYSRRARVLRWRDLTDPAIWKRGWV